MARILNMGRIYSRPCREDTLANAGQISTCVQVGVRPQTTLSTHETVFGALAKPSAARARLAGIGRAHVLDRDAGGPRLVVDETPQLPKGPAVESRAHPPAGFDAVTDVRQVLHRDLADSRSFGLGDDSLARFVIDVLHAPHLLAGDLPELLPCALAAVGLKTATQGKVSVAPMTQWPTAEDLARASGGEGIFSDIHAHHSAGWPRFGIVRFHNQVEVPHPLTQDELRFLRRPDVRTLL